MLNSLNASLRLAAAVEQAWLDVALFTAERVRAALTGSETAGDAVIEQALRLWLKDFPEPRKSNHERDGLASALFMLLDARLRAGSGS